MTVVEETDDRSSSGRRWSIDDDEDNWSRQVETDDVLQRMPSNSDDVDHKARPQPQPRPQPTLKEKLVERERQRRVESERARWKRQFAMAAHAEDETTTNDNNNNTPNGARENHNGNSNNDNATVLDPTIILDGSANERSFLLNDRNSVAGTVGEDTVAPIETLEEENNNNETTMNYPMERFLQEQQANGDNNNNNSSSNVMNNRENTNRDNNNMETTNQVVMERFLQEQPTAPASFVGESSPMSPMDHQLTNNSRRGDLPSNGLVEDDHASPVHIVDDNAYQSPSNEPRVVLRLTEAEIQEMAAIDDASRSNAPPSERDDISELGELVSDFPHHLIVDHQTMSQGTPVTAMESVTSSMGNQIEQIVLSSNGCDIEISEEHSVSSNVVAASSADGDVSLTGNPPSDIVRDDDDEDDETANANPMQVPTEILPPIVDELSIPPFTTDALKSVPRIAAIPSSDSDVQLQKNAADETIVNRKMRPGMFQYSKAAKQDNGNNNSDFPETPPSKKPSNGPHIEGFDFDKNVYSPSLDQNQADVFMTRNEMWSPGLSPDFDQGNNIHDSFLDYGATTDRFGKDQPNGTTTATNQYHRDFDDDNHESKPLLKGIPPAVDVSMGRRDRHGRRRSSLGSIRNFSDLNSLAESVFSDIRSESTETRMSISNEAEEYKACSVLARAFPERMFALMVTLIFEMPTLFLISGGSDQLCGLIGRTKYTTLIALLPIVSAVSGNVGLQASTLTTRAISHGQVKVQNYTSWLGSEIGAALYLGEWVQYSHFSRDPCF